MKKRIKVADLPEFDSSKYLDSEAAIAIYLTDILEANDAALLASALGKVARARGMTEIAKALDRSRFTPHVGCFRPDGMRGAELAAAGVPVVHFPVDSFLSFGALREAWRHEQSNGQEQKRRV